MQRLKYYITAQVLALACLAIIGCYNQSEPSLNASREEKIQDQKRAIVRAVYEGRQLFTANCYGCHLYPETRKEDQFMFDRIFDRLPEPAEEYLIKYISDSKALKDSGDSYALSRDEMWNSSYEHSFRDTMSLDDIKKLVVYIKMSAPG